MQGDISETKQLAAERLELSRQRRDPRGTAAALEALLYVAQVEGDLGRVQFLLEEMLALLRHGDVHSDADLRERLERMAFEMTTLARYEQAMTLIEEGIALSLREGDRRDAAHFGVRLALFAREQGRFDWAESVLRESLAAVAVGQGEAELAVRIFGATDTLRACAGTPVRPMLRERLDRDVAAARAALSPEQFSQAYARGQALPPEQVITTALHDLAFSQLFLIYPNKAI